MPRLKASSALLFFVKFQLIFLPLLILIVYRDASSQTVMTLKRRIAELEQGNKQLPVRLLDEERAIQNQVNVAKEKAIQNQVDVPQDRKESYFGSKSQKLSLYNEISSDLLGELKPNFYRVYNGSYSGEHTKHPIPKVPKIIVGDVEICSKAGSNLKYFIYIHSAIRNVERRQNLRSTWANPRFFKDGRIRVVFVFGVPVNYTEEERDIVTKESGKYGDILQGDFIDGYYNLTVKGILALNFITTYCSGVDYVIKTDDDTFFDVYKIFQILEANKHYDNLVICAVWSRMGILRDQKDCYKWCIPEEDFPGERKYPTYCAGLFFMVSYSIIDGMQRAASSTPYFKIDDVYISGLLMGKAVLELKGNVKYVTVLANTCVNEVDFEKERVSNNKFMSAIENPDRYSRMWNQICQEWPTNFTAETNL